MESKGLEEEIITRDDGVKRVNNLPLFIVGLIIVIFILSIILVGVSRMNKKNENSSEIIDTSANIQALTNMTLGSYEKGIIQAPSKPEVIASSNNINPGQDVFLDPLDSTPTDWQQDNPSGPILIQKKDQLADLRFQELQKALKSTTEVPLSNNDGSTSSYEFSLQEKTPFFHENRSLEANSYQFSAEKEVSYSDFEKKGKDRWSLNEIPKRAKTNFIIQTGFVIPAILLTSIVSDIPGKVTAQTTKNVYDSITGKYLLIPQGSRLIGTYSSNIKYGQSRILIAWQRILFPNGTNLDIGAMAGVDEKGVSGFEDKVDNHYSKIFGSALIMSAIVGGLSYSDSLRAKSENRNLSSEMSAAFGQQIGQTSMKILEKNIDIAPTIEIRQGYRFNIMVTKDIAFATPYRS